MTDRHTNLFDNDPTITELLEALEMLDSGMLEITDTETAEKYAERVRNSDEIRHIIESEEISGPLQFDPSSEVTKEVLIVEQKEKIKLRIVDKIEIENGNLDYTGSVSNIASGYLIDEEFHPISIINNHSPHPLAGRGRKYYYEDEEVKSTQIWVS